MKLPFNLEKPQLDLESLIDRASRSGKEGYVLCFLLGVAVGVVAGVLAAPDSGAETRRKLLDRASNLGDSLTGSFDEEEEEDIDETYSQYTPEPLPERMTTRGKKNAGSPEELPDRG